MPDITEIGKYIQTATAGANKQHQEKALEAKKIENENLKLQLEMEKAQNQASLDQAKTLTEAAKVKSETVKTEAEVRGIEQDNIGKKAQNIQILSQDPTQPVVEGEGKQVQKPAGQATGPVKFQFGEEEVAGSEFRMPPPRQPPPVPKIPKTLLQEYFDSLDAQARGEAGAMEARDIINEGQEIALKNYQKAANDYQVRMSKNLAMRKKVLDEIPTYKSAAGGVNWLAKIVSVFDAGMLGHLRESPTYMLDLFVQKEYQDQMMKYKAKTDFLTAQENIYGKFYDLNKDELEAQTSTLATLYKSAEDQVKSLAVIADTREKKFKTMETLEQLEHKRMIEERKLEASEKQKAWKQFKEQTELGLKKIKRETEIAKLGQTAEKIELTRQKQEFAQATALRKRSIELGTLENPIKFAFATEKDATEARDAFNTSGSSIRGARQIEAKVAELDAAKAAKAPWAILGGKGSKKALALFEDINKGLVEIMLKRRIEFTGGGNMNKDELSWMKWFYGVVSGMPATQIVKMISKKWAGQYDTIINMIKKASFNTMYNKLKKSRQFDKGLSKAEQFRLVAKELGINEKEIPIILKDHTAGLKGLKDAL